MTNRWRFIVYCLAGLAACLLPTSAACAETTCSTFTIYNTYAAWDGGEPRITFDSCIKGSEYVNVAILAPLTPIGCNHYFCMGCNPDCSDSEESGGGQCAEHRYDGLTARIKIVGDKDAFRAYYPNGIEVTSTGENQCGTGYGFFITDPNEWYEVPVICFAGSGETFARLSLKTLPAVGEYREEKTFTIHADFYRGCSHKRKPVGIVKEEFTIKQNERVDFDPFNFLGYAMENVDFCWIDQVIPGPYINHFTAMVEREGEDPWCIPSLEVNDEYVLGTNYRVKFPPWQEDVYAGLSLTITSSVVDVRPSYISGSGWSWSWPDKYVSLDLGGLGTFYYVCTTNKIEDDPNSPQLFTEIEYCESGESFGEGETIWNLQYLYDDDGIARINYVYDNTDPNNPLNCDQYISYTWDGGYTEAEIKYYNTQESNDPLRVHSIAVDEQGRKISESSDCGCSGSSSQYYKKEYFADDEYSDLIEKTYNSANDVTQWNQYTTLTYGEYDSQQLGDTRNASFEVPDPADGQSQTGRPDFWDEVVVNDDVAVFDPNSTQWQSRYDQGETLPDGDQILNFTGGSIKQDVDEYVVNDTLYFLDLDVGAYNDNGTSEATIKLVAYDINDVNEVETPIELIVLNPKEGGNPSNDEIPVTEGTWESIEGAWNSSENDDILGYRLRIILEGDVIDIDNIQLYSMNFMGGDTRPLLTWQMADPIEAGEPNILFVTWQYDTEDKTAIERKWIDSTYARVIKYLYADNALNNLSAKTEYETLNDDPDQPSGNSYTTYYGYDSDNDIKYITYPSGKRVDYDERTSGYTTKSYSYDVDSEDTTNTYEYTYSSGNITSQTDPRGGVTTYTYKSETDLLEKLEEPQVNGQGQVTEHEYDGAERVVTE